jgi:hypothetical protein
MITRATLSSVVQGLPKYRSMLAGNTGYVPPSFESISTTVLSSNTGWVNLTSIPSTYKHLQVRIVGRCLQSGSSQSLVSMICNSDQTNSYSWHRLFGDTSFVNAANAITQPYAYIGDVPTNGWNSNIFGAMIIDILDYASTSKFKTIRAQGGWSADGAGRSNLFSGLWQKTTAINELSFSNQNNAQDWTAGTTFSLYGIKG